MNILLVCSGGASTSILVENMKENLPEQYSDWSINATSTTEAKEIMGKYDYVLLAPQVRFQKKTFSKIADPLGIKIFDMNSSDYGRNNGKAILKLVIDDIERE